jgi:predicted nucleic acid-binding protein
VTYAINPVVLQELLLVILTAADSSTLDELTKRMEVLPVDSSTVEESLKSVRELRNRTIHANELLILGSAQSCDYLVTMDRDLQQIAGRATMKAIVLTPTQKGFRLPPLYQNKPRKLFEYPPTQTSHLP